ncbi:hypothetical protein OUP81_001246 [Campylobacter upsaliensis]|uniref:Uncharacterized protein n=1 Tax=Campylobacter upsaliensis TaxID=28080 RepID=A0A5L4Q5K2_CAMUP|nr:hypothetical protein [Campylobacter upsaliensis]EAH5199771.1 hypothetical protein [Campylobacter upsaliensis]EAH5676621.1 hypothetical protein [Campylobacter upsaliensis]EAI2894173.1 hypothetical protein [Campylobacter upsaliensis]EAI4456806.1 hypothetical protein [Campylobacter upsaliensis]
MLGLLSGLLGNTKLYIALGAMSVGLVIAGLYIRTLKAENESLENSLRINGEFSLLKSRK